MKLSSLNAVTANQFENLQNGSFNELELSRVYPNPEQPRKQFKNIDELATSIKKHGLLQPIVVEKTDIGYMIINGERRFKAHQLNNSTTIKAHIIEADEHKVLEMTLIENIQREDLTDFEIAQFIIKLWDSGKYAQKQDLAAALGKSQSYISKALGMWKLDEIIITDMQEQKHDIGLSVLEEISRVPDKKIQKEVYDLVVNKKMTREQIKNFKALKGWDESKVTEVPQKKISLGKKGNGQSQVWETVPDDKIDKKKSITEIVVQQGFGGMLFNGNSISDFINKNFEIDKRYKITVEEI
ncbi:MAG: ParB/RepB/Spo0J family partition protein [Campylobacterales bacterium]|nr:ParB/RepB/Spo0J family partition protein [Campylobacterales bacterium]